MFYFLTGNTQPILNFIEDDFPHIGACAGVVENHNGTTGSYLIYGGNRNGIISSLLQV